MTILYCSAVPHGSCCATLKMSTGGVVIGIMSETRQKLVEAVHGDAAILAIGSTSMSIKVLQIFQVPKRSFAVFL